MRPPSYYQPPVPRQYYTHPYYQPPPIRVDPSPTVDNGSRGHDGAHELRSTITRYQSAGAYHTHQLYHSYYQQQYHCIHRYPPTTHQYPYHAPPSYNQTQPSIDTRPIGSTPNHQHYQHHPPHIRAKIQRQIDGTNTKKYPPLPVLPLESRHPSSSKSDNNNDKKDTSLPVEKNTKLVPVIKKARRHRLCSVEGCTKIAKKGGTCIKHGAKVRKCSHKGCTNNALKSGVCIRHGAKITRRYRYALPKIQRQINEANANKKKNPSYEYNPVPLESRTSSTSDNNNDKKDTPPPVFTAFDLFCKYKHPIVKAELSRYNPEVSIDDVNKFVAEKWKYTSLEERKKYDVLASTGESETEVYLANVVTESRQPTDDTTTTSTSHDNDRIPPPAKRQRTIKKKEVELLHEALMKVYGPKKNEVRQVAQTKAAKGILAELFQSWLCKRKEVWRKEREDRKRDLEELYLAAEEVAEDYIDEELMRQLMLQRDEDVISFYSSGTINTNATLLADKYRLDFNSMSEECEEKVVVLEQLASCYDCKLHEKKEGFDEVVVNGLECGMELRHMNWYLRLHGRYDDFPFVGKSSDDYLLCKLTCLTQRAQQKKCIIQSKRKKHLIVPRGIKDAIHMTASLLNQINANSSLEEDHVKQAEKVFTELPDMLCYDEDEGLYEDLFDVSL